MFTKGSRYRKLPEVVLAGADGRPRRAVEPRPLPPAPGVLLHTLAEGERLDTIANAYYRQPRKWWQICDANPEFLSPLALLGQEPLATARFPLALASRCTQAPWDALLRALTALVGVEDVQIEETWLPPEWPASSPQGAEPERYARAVVVVFNRMTLSVTQLAAAITAVRGLEPGQPELSERAGAPIAIPADLPA